MFSWTFSAKLTMGSRNARNKVTTGPNFGSAHHLNEHMSPYATPPPCYHSRMPSLAAVGIIVLALLIAAALFLLYEIGKLVGEKRATDKFPEAKKAAVQRSRSVLSGMFGQQLAPYLPNFPFSPTEAKFIGAPIDFLVFKSSSSK